MRMFYMFTWIWVPPKTTPRQDRAFRMNRQGRFKNAWALTAQKGNLYGMRADLKDNNNRLLSHGHRAYRPRRKSLLTANYRKLCL